MTGNRESVRVAVASRSFSRHPVLRAELSAQYPNIAFNDEGRTLAGESLIAFLKGHERAIIGLERLDAAVFRALPDLKVVSKYGVGLDMIDLEAMARHCVKLGWTGGVNRRAVAELVIAFAVMFLRHVPTASAEMRDGVWRARVCRQLSERTVGIVGCGHIGQDLAALLRAFGCRVLAHDIRDFPEFYARHRIEPVGLDDLLRRADIVTLHLPLDATTRNLMSADRLALLRPDAILINAARGGIVDEGMLKTMLKSGRLTAAAFDVFATEPPEDMELLRLPNFLATPHIGGAAEEAILAMGRAAIAGLDKAGDPRGVANP